MNQEHKTFFKALGMLVALEVAPLVLPLTTARPRLQPWSAKQKKANKSPTQPSEADYERMVGEWENWQKLVKTEGFISEIWSVALKRMKVLEAGFFL